ncbi:MAG: acyl carrier protein [Bdellovibrionales bacterium]|nr:acyl carrier protein [Bdellovibrionales bacterium]
MNQNVFLTIQKLASEKFSISLDLIEPSKDIFTTLQINSVDVLSMLTDLENHFSIEIPDYELQDVRSFEDLTNVISDRL